MSVTDELVQNAERYADSFDKGVLPGPPARQVAAVPRLNPYALLEDIGTAHVLLGLLSDETETAGAMALEKTGWAPLAVRRVVDDALAAGTSDTAP